MPKKSKDTHAAAGFADLLQGKKTGKVAFDPATAKGPKGPLGSKRKMPGIKLMAVPGKSRGR
jgi:hypothetical protein